MKQHVFQPGENIEQIARQYGFLLPTTIWDDASNESLRQLRKSAYALAGGDVLNIPDLQIKQEDASDEKRHVFQLRGLIRPAFYSRLVADPDLPAARFGPVFSQPGAVGFDVSFAPHLGGALTHVAAAHDGAKFRAVVAGRGRLAQGPMLHSVGYLLLGNKQAWVADALARHDDDDLRVLLIWIANVLGFPCDPGKPGDPAAQGFGHALRRLRSAADITHGTVLYKPDMEPRPEEDLTAIFDAVEERLRAAANLSSDAMKKARAKIEFLSPAWVDLTQNDGIEGVHPAASLDLVLFDDQVVKATPGQVHPLLAKLSSFMYSSLETKETPTTFKKIKLDIVEFEDVHFGPKRSVFLPTELTAAGPGEHWGITGADVLVAALRNAKAYPKRVLLIRGHTDSTSTRAENLVLSKKRAEGVRLVLSGMDHAAEWAQHATADGNPDDANEYLRWIDERFGFGCRPSAFDEPDARKDGRALQAFRSRYNEVVEAARTTSFNPYLPAFQQPLPDAGPLSTHDWRAFFELMQRYLAEQQRMLIKDLLPVQRALNFKSEAVGCGESHPLNLKDRERKRLAMYPEEDLGESPSDRRVDLVFLEPDEYARIPDPMLCHEKTDAGACKPELCMLYDQRFFEFRRLSAEPQRGKIEIIERTVMRDKRVFTSDEVKLVEDTSGDFTPILAEKARILVRVTPPFYPFEGEARVTIGRRTNDERLISSVATIKWKDAKGNAALKLTKPTPLVFEWDGYATQSVPREYSDRETKNEKDELIFMPMMEMEPGQRAKHGPYVIEVVQLFAKDTTVAAAYAPDDQERDELTMVVQPTIEVAIYENSSTSTGGAPHDLQNLLSEVGFGEGNKPDPTPLTLEVEELAPKVFTVALEHAIARRIVRFYAGVNIRFIATIGSPKTTALVCGVECQQAFTGGDPAPFLQNGETNTSFSAGGLEVFQNLYLWFDQHQGPKREGDSRVHTRAFLYGPLTDEGGESALLSAFGRVGFPPGRRVVQRKVRNVPGELPDWVDRFFLEGGPNTPRTVDDDEVVGLVDQTDAANSTVKVDPSNGVVTVSTSNLAVVPPRRASDIARAINACAAWISYIAAHELGHLLGASVTQSQNLNKSGALKAIPMPDGSSVGPYMDQDPEGEDPKPAATQLMSPSAHSFAQRLGLTGPAMTLLSSQRDYLKAVAPFAADFAKPEEP